MVHTTTQVYKIIECLEHFKVEHGLASVPVILCGLVWCMEYIPLLDQAKSCFVYQLMFGGAFW